MVVSSFHVGEKDYVDLHLVAPSGEGILLVCRMACKKADVVKVYMMVCEGLVASSQMKEVLDPLDDHNKQVYRISYGVLAYMRVYGILIFLEGDSHGLVVPNDQVCMMAYGALVHMKVFLEVVDIHGLEVLNGQVCRMVYGNLVHMNAYLVVVDSYGLEGPNDLVCKMVYDTLIHVNIYPLEVGSHD